MKAYSHSKTPISERDRRETPDFVFSVIQGLVAVSFVWDVCAEKRTSKCGENYWGPDKGNDAFSIDWAREIGKQEGRLLGPVWMNPPYSNPKPWCLKAICESRKGLIVVGLLPDDRSTDWYRQCIDNVAITVFIPNRRIPFLLDGKPQSGNPKGSVVPIWTPWITGGTEYSRFNL